MHQAVRSRLAVRLSEVRLESAEMHWQNAVEMSKGHKPDAPPESVAGLAAKYSEAKNAHQRAVQAIEQHKRDVAQNASLAASAAPTRSAKEILNHVACTTMAGETTGKVGDGGPIVPMKSANVLMRMLDGAESVKATFGFSECWFETDRGIFWCRLLEGRFPAWKQVIPKFDDWTVDAMVPVGPFAALIRQAAIVADAESRGVNFTFTGGTLRAGAQVADPGPL